MKKYAKIGLIVGAVGAVGVVLRSAVRKSFDHGFRTGVSVSATAADGVISVISEKYNNLVDEYNELAEDYCELLDEVECPLDEDSEETEEE